MRRKVEKDVLWMAKDVFGIVSNFFERKYIHIDVLNNENVVG